MGLRAGWSKSGHPDRPQSPQVDQFPLGCDLLRDVDDLAVGVHRDTPQVLERLVGVDVEATHHDALGLAYQVAVLKSGPQLVDLLGLGRDVRCLRYRAVEAANSLVSSAHRYFRSTILRRKVGQRFPHLRQAPERLPSTRRK